MLQVVGGLEETLHTHVVPRVLGFRLVEGGAHNFHVVVAVVADVQQLLDVGVERADGEGTAVERVEVAIAIHAGDVVATVVVHPVIAGVAQLLVVVERDVLVLYRSIAPHDRTLVILQLIRIGDIEKRHCEQVGLKTGRVDLELSLVEHRKQQSITRATHLTSNTRSTSLHIDDGVRIVGVFLFKWNELVIHVVNQLLRSRNPL